MEQEETELELYPIQFPCEVCAAAATLGEAGRLQAPCRLQGGGREALGRLPLIYQASPMII